MFLKTPDADLFVSECGPTSGRTIVAHGGWVGSGELWAQPFEELSKRWRCVTYDHRGTGATRHRGGPIKPEMLVDDLFRVLDALKVDRCVLGGESAGGLTVLQAASRAPDVIRPVSDSEFMHSRIPGSRLLVLEDAGHVPITTRPSRVAAEIGAFFS